MRPRSRPERVRRLRTALALTTICLLSLPALAHGAEKALSVDLTWGIATNEFAPTGAAITDTGARWVRLEFRWNEAEPTSKGQYDQNTIAKYDRAIDTALAAGSKVLVFVNGSPSWASGSRNRMAAPRNPADYADFIRFVATRYAGKVSAWEVWNEQNTSRFWPSGPSPSAYVPLLKATYPVVKSIDTNALVVFGGVSQNDYHYIEGAYAAGAKGYFDVMAVHPYPGPHPPEAVWYGNGRIGTTAFTGFTEVRKSMLAQGDDKPIWITEFGWSTTTTASWGVTYEQQADYLTRAYRLLEAYPYVEMGVWYNLRNNHWNDDADTWETQLGLMRTDFVKKPSYYAFKGYVPGVAPANPVAPPPPPSPPTDPSSPAPPTLSPKAPAPTGTAPTATAPSGQAPAGTRRRTSTSLSLTRRVSRARARAANRGVARELVIAGRVTGASGGQVQIRLRRRDSQGRWVLLRKHTVTLAGDGTFRLRLGFRRARWLLVRAVYQGSATAAPSGSEARRVRS
jgi:hypothetical protein